MHNGHKITIYKSQAQYLSNNTYVKLIVKQ